MARPTAGHAGGDRDDESLLAAFVDGDEAAFAELVGRYARRVHGICYRYFGDPTDAEDAAQDAFLALYRRASTFRGGAAFSTWMYRVTTNACNDLARKRARRPRKSEVEVTDVPLADPVDRVEQRLLQLELREALLQLDPAHRRAVVGHTVEGRPYHEIAESEGVAVGTIKSRVHRGHARLAAIVAERRADPSGPSRPEPHGHPAEDPASGTAVGGEPSGRAPPPT